MTKLEAIGKLLRWLADQVGYREGANNYNIYASIAKPLIGWDAQNQPWCDIFTDAAFISCFGLENASRMTYQPIGKGSAKCSVSADFFKFNRAFFQQPQIGDVVFFFVGDGINHQGIVVDIDEQGIETIEGNSGDMVQRNRYANSYPYIAGFGRPDWSVLTGEAADTTTPEQPAPSVQTTNSIPVLCKGSKGEVVKSAQLLLIGRNFSCGAWGADGDFGNATKQAVENFQTERNLEVDGIVGAQTWAKLLGL